MGHRDRGPKNERPGGPIIWAPGGSPGLSTERYACLLLGRPTASCRGDGPGRDRPPTLRRTAVAERTHPAELAVTAGRRAHGRAFEAMSPDLLSGVSSSYSSRTVTLRESAAARLPWLGVPAAMVLGAPPGVASPAQPLPPRWGTSRIEGV